MRHEIEHAREGQRARDRAGDRLTVGLAQHVVLVALTEAQAVVCGGRHEEHERDRGGDERCVVDISFCALEVAELRREADREQETEQHLCAGDKGAELLEELVVLALEPVLAILAALLLPEALPRRIRHTLTPTGRLNAAACPRALASRSSPSSSAPIRSRSSSSSRRCVRIISGPSVAIVNGTSWSTNEPIVSRTASSSGSAFVRRLEVGQISSVMPRSRSDDMSSRSPAARIP